MPSVQQLKEQNTELLNSLIFPSDLESTELFYPEAIRFGIYERQSIDLKKVKEDALSTTPDDRTVQRASKPSEISDNSFDNNLTSSPRFPLAQRREQNDADVNQARMFRDLEPAEEQDVLGAAGRAAVSVSRQLQAPTPTELAKRHIRSIYLAMPNSLIYNEAVDWSGTDLGALVGGLLSGNVASAASAGALANSGALLGGAAGAALSGGGKVAGAVLGTILGASSAVGSGIESTFNIKANPYKEQTFQGVGFRPFEFSFVFRPRNEEEVIVTQEIIRNFRAYSRPSFKSAGQAGLFAYPKEFLIEFLVKDADEKSGSGGRYYINENLPQIKFCVLKTVGTNYTGQGWRTLENGAPADITLNLSFEETEIVTQEDVFGNTSTGDFKNIGGNF